MHLNEHNSPQLQHVHPIATLQRQPQTLLQPTKTFSAYRTPAPTTCHWSYHFPPFFLSHPMQHNDDVPPTSTTTTISNAPQPPMTLSLLLASAAAGTLSRIFVHPIDTLRSRLMTSSSQSLRSTLTHILRTDGPRGLYRGFGVASVLIAPAYGTYICAYDIAKEQMIQRGYGDCPLTHLTSGIIAGNFSAIFWVPMEVVKQRAQVSVGAVSASHIVMRQTLLKEGALGLYRGYGLTVAVFGPYSMVYFTTLERLKKLWGEPVGVGGIMMCAGGAGAVAGGVTTPLDVVKTRMQTQGRGGWEVASEIWRRDGLRGFARGAGVRVAWIAPGAAITWGGVEGFRNWFGLT